MSKAIFQAHIEQIWNNKDASGIERFIAPNYRGFDAAELISGIEGYKQHFVTLTTAFPDLRITIEVILEEVIREGETRAAARFVVEATHTGNLGDIPPTGKRVRVTGIAVVRIRNRQIVEEHANSDTLGLLKQLGVISESVKVPLFIF
jgi:predicted ester cyclase